MPNANNSGPQPSRTIYIPVDGDSDCFGAAYYHALLAYPKDTEQRKLKGFINAVTGYLTKEYISTGGKRVDIPRHYRKLKREKIYTKIDQGLYRISAWRLPAATMAYKIILHNPEIWNRLPPEFHPELRTRMSINQAAHEITNLLDEGRKERQHNRHKKEFGWYDRPNIMSRIWGGTKPVLHLAIAYPTSPGKTTDPMALIENPSSWLPQAVRHAEVLRSVLHHFVPSFDPSKAIRLLPSQK